MVESSVDLNETCEKINSTSATVRYLYKDSTSLRSEASLDNPKLPNSRSKGKMHNSLMVRSHSHYETLSTAS